MSYDRMSRMFVTLPATVPFMVDTWHVEEERLVTGRHVYSTVILLLFQIPALCEGIPVVQSEGLTQCSNIVGYLAVYRVCFALSIFFLFFMVLMIKVQSSKDPRSKIQNG